MHRHAELLRYRNRYYRRYPGSRSRAFRWWRHTG
jgi:hypothetical protein